MRVFALIAFANDDVPELHVFQDLHDGFVVAMLERVGVDADGAGEQIRILRKADETRADCLTRDVVKRKTVNMYATFGEIEHTKESENEGGFAARNSVSKCIVA
jgi:hypothetical protein